jgi:sec-independent protein translocase protein TatA
MLGGLGPLELGIILVIVILIFGVGRIGKIAGEMGSGIRAFRDGLKGDEEEGEAAQEEETEEEAEA